MSFQARGLALECLVEAGVVVQVSIGRRNRTFEANELADAFTAFERWLASPEGRHPNVVRRRAGYFTDSDRDSVVNTDRSNMPGHQPNPDRVRHCGWEGCRFGPVKGTCRDIPEEVIGDGLIG